ncbi:MAG: WecB/TagA/CpsF family glycosyltransferase [Thermoguttaceae bacterium]
MAMQLEIPACQRTELLGIPLDNVTLAEAVETIVERLDGPLPQQVCFVNADCVNIAFRHPQYLDALRHADLVFADGIGLKLAGMALGSPVRDNVNGTDLFPRLCEALSGTGKRLYLLGARPGGVDDLCVWIASHYPGVAIAGSRHGYFSADEEPAVIEAIADSGADLVLVAFGAPRQELWTQRHLGELGVKVAIGVGGLFDFYSGRIPRAPRWMRRAGLEWLYRLCQEPGRLWRRYVLGNPLFLLRVALALRGKAA